MEQTIKKIKDYLDKCEGMELALFREPRFVGIEDDIIQLSIQSKYSDHHFFINGLDGFFDGMNLKDLLYIAEYSAEEIAYSHWSMGKLINNIK